MRAKLPSRCQILFVFLVFAVFVGLAYQKAFEAPFYFDDIPNIVNNHHIHLQEVSLKSVGEVFSSLEGFSKRPVAHLSFALNYYFHQLDTTGYHLVNVVIHVLTGLFLWLLLASTFRLVNLRVKIQVSSIRDEYSRSLSMYGLLTAFLAALIWLVHPVQTQSVTYVVQRMTSMAGMFYILSLLLYVKGRNTDRWWKQGFAYFGCLLAWLMALGSKEIAITMPLFVLLYEWYFFQNLEREWLKRAIPYILGTLILLATVVGLYWGGNPWHAIISGYRQWDFNLTERLLTECRVVLYYLSLIVFPHPDRLSVNYDFALSHSFVEPITTLFSFMTILGLLLLGGLSAKKSPAISFGILWFFGHLVIESSVVPLDLVFEHRLYLPSMFLLAIVPPAVVRMVRRDRWVFGLLIALVIFLSLGTYQRNSVWSDPLAFSQDSVAKSPESPRSHNWLGLSLASKGEYEEAIFHYKKALQLQSDFAPAHNNWAIALVELERYDEAISHYRAALRIRPRYPRALYGMGVAYIQKGMPTKALESFSRAVRINPNYAEALNQMGYLLAQQGKIDQAVSHLTMAVRIRPEYGSAHYNLGVALTSQGKLKDAVFHYRKALDVLPEHAKAHNNLGILLAEQGKFAEAVSHFSRALEINPDFLSAEKNLRRARAMMK